MPKYWFRPECGSEDRIGPDVGPFDDFFQLTYGLLRAGPDGEFVAQFGKDNEWTLCIDGIAKLLPGFEISSENATAWWSDIVIWAE